MADISSADKQPKEPGAAEDESPTVLQLFISALDALYDLYGVVSTLSPDPSTSQDSREMVIEAGEGVGAASWVLERACTLYRSGARPDPRDFTPEPQ